ncbi:MAG: hypothetical protein ACKVQW_16980 [Pyrinomonadaceae bacterium]
MKGAISMTFVSLFVTLFFFVDGVFAQSKSAMDAMKIWDKVIAAKGGRDKLYAVHTLAVTTRGRNDNDEKEFQNLFMQDLYVLPDRWWRWSDQRPGFPLYAEHYDFDKEIGYGVSGLSNRIVTFRPNKPRTVGGSANVLEFDGSTFNNSVKERFFDNQMIYLMETKWFKPTVLGFRREKVGSNKNEVIEASFGRNRYEYFLDPKTNLPNKINIITCFPELRVCNEDTLYLSDYIETSGVKLPQVVSRGKGDNKRTTYQVNVAFNQKIFDSPPSIAAGPGAWQQQE